MSDSLRLFLRPEVQQLIDAFAACFRVRVTLFSADCRELRSAPGDRVAPFCSLVQQSLGRRAECLSTDRGMCRRSAALDSMARYRCHAGLLEAVMPVKAEGMVIGYLMLGQFRDAEAPAAAVLKAAPRPDAARGLAEAYALLPRYDAEAGDNMMRLFTMLVNYVVSQNYVSLERGPLVDQVAAFVRENVGRTIGPDAVAAAVGRSRSTVAHAVAAKTGLSLGKLIRLRKVEAFEAQPARRPEIGVAEAARELGFDDPLYFSRVYRRVRGEAPRSFLARRRAAALRTEAAAAETVRGGSAAPVGGS